jgi:mono/diheme cytochrome c family protein
VRRATYALLALIAVLGVATLAACGGGDDEASPDTDTSVTETNAGGDVEGDAVAGKQIFVSNCAGCHTLADAGTTGTIGPNLDDAQPSSELVTDRVTNGQGVMPSFAGALSDQQIADVAAYVSETAGS